MDEIILKNCIGFEWDAGNSTKNQDKHNVSRWECEQIFFNIPFLIYEDVKHSHLESRIYGLGKTDGGRRLFVVFTIRNQHIRIISARDMSQRERKLYEKN